MPYAKVNNINMYYEIHGEGEPLIMILGMANSLDTVRDQIPYFESEFQFILYDSRGTGRTDAPDIPYTPKMMADDVAGLLDAINIEATHVRGVSLGGVMAQYFTLSYPERVISLILSGTSFGGPNVIRNADASQSVQAVFDLSLTQEQRVRKAMEINVTSEYAEKNPEFIEERVKSSLEYPRSPVGAKRFGELANIYDNYDRLKEIKVPTLIIHGDADQVSPVENARIMAERIPNTELVIFNNTGHLLVEAGDERYRVMVDFLRRHSQK